MDNKEKIYENRIYNIQWAGACDYDIEPEIIGQNIDGNPDFYINLIIGISYKYLGYDPIKKLFALWQSNLKRDKFDMTLIYLLEDFAYHKEIKIRPRLESLRKSYAEKFLSDRYDLQRRNLSLRQNLIYRLEIMRNHDILGIANKRISKKDAYIYNNFRLGADTNSKNLKERVIKLFNKFLGYRHSQSLKFISNLNFSLFDSAGLMSLERSNLPADFNSKNKTTNKALGLILDIINKHKKEKLDFIEKTFGKALFSDQQRLAIENQICKKVHKKSRIYFSRGIEKSDKNFDQATNDKAIKRHLVKFKENQNTYTRAINIISREIKLKINQTSSFDYELSKKGKLISNLAYKAQISDRARIFEKKSLTNSPSMKVDLLIDGSASILDKESEVAIEAYIISKSLENNNILNRIISFQTLSDFTILTILKDFSEKAEMERIFRFKSMGWNRDGLVFRAYSYLLKKNSKNTLTLVLTDANPSDLKPLISEEFKFNKAYQDSYAIKDTQQALISLRKKGINLAGIINSDKVDNARDLYHQDFIKISDIKEISFAAARFIKNQLNNL